MMPDGVGLPARPSAKTLNEQTAAEQRTNELRAMALVAVMLILAAMLQLFARDRLGDVNLDFLYRRLYYLPIMYAAFVFGRRGGLVAALVSSVPFLVHAQLNADRFLAFGFDNWI